MRRYLSLPDPASELGWMAAQVDAIFDESIQIARDTGDGILNWKSPTDRDETRAGSASPGWSRCWSSTACRSTGSRPGGSRCP